MRIPGNRRYHKMMVTDQVDRSNPLNLLTMSVTQFSAHGKQYCGQVVELLRPIGKFVYRSNEPANNMLRIDAVQKLHGIRQAFGAKPFSIGVGGVGKSIRE